MENLEHLKNCQIFTPEKVVKQMLDEIEYDGVSILNKTIIDNSCGDGNFLVEIVKRIIKQAKSQGINTDDIRQILQCKVFGCDIDLEMVERSIERLNKLVFEEGIPKTDWNINCQDGLFFDKEKFDFVVGNPPYVSYSDLEKETRKILRNNFKSCKKGKFDYLYAFIEKGLSLLKNDGKMVMITPLNMYKTVYGSELRSLIKPHVLKIIDMANQKVFKKVLTSPVITVFQINSQVTDLLYCSFVNKNMQIKKICKDTLGDKWEFTDYKNKGKIKFGDSFKVANCVATLANKIFVHDVNEDGSIDVDIEEELLRDAASPKTKQYGKKQKIIFPYKFNNNLIIRYSEDEMDLRFPMAMNFLRSKKYLLLQRDSDDKAAWYEFGRSQALNQVNCEKLLMSTIITNEVKVYYLDKEEVPYSGIYVIPKKNNSLEEALKILRSKRFYRYIKSIGIKVNGNSLRISSKDIENYMY